MPREDGFASSFASRLPFCTPPLDKIAKLLDSLLDAALEDNWSIRQIPETVTPVSNCSNWHEMPKPKRTQSLHKIRHSTTSIRKFLMESSSVSMSMKELQKRQTMTINPHEYQALCRHDFYTFMHRGFRELSPQTNSDEAIENPKTKGGYGCRRTFRHLSCDTSVVTLTLPQFEQGLAPATDFEVRSFTLWLQCKRPLRASGSSGSCNMRQ
jgi:hypothetical protein